MEGEKKENPLFNIINALFKDKEYINNLTYENAKQNIFMILRRIAIKYPIRANIFNNGKINPLDTIKFFSEYLYSGYTPKWIYVSANKEGKKNSDKSKITSFDIKMYKNYYKIGEKDFNSAMKLFPDETINDIVELRKLFEN